MGVLWARSFQGFSLCVSSIALKLGFKGHPVSTPTSNLTGDLGASGTGLMAAMVLLERQSHRDSLEKLTCGIGVNVRLAKGDYSWWKIAQEILKYTNTPPPTPKKTLQENKQNNNNKNPAKGRKPDLIIV